ncbi:C-type lectin domain family 10 member A isoform X3 [Equus przewalskii]|uniref:C-type lectin domain family 10 member A isoform X3 n=1 Tax=Equus przewalskii TaxID=9798 RepID=A0ABM4JU14_EQUPR|nr:C-type lectin domain family 10 member A-like isoform X1 [Equus caballus]
MWSDYGTSLVLGLPIGNTGEQQYLSLCGACCEEPRRQCVSSACSVLHRGGLIIFALIVPFASSDSTFQRDLVTLNNSTSQTELQVKALISQGDSLQKTITPLKAGVGNLRQELQAARSMNDKVFSLEKKLEEEQQTLKADYAEIRLLVQQLAKDLTALTCQAAALKSNGSARACCPLNWLEHEGSCYWFSRSKKPWPEAEKQCQLQNAHLVVINSREEQDFVQEHTGSSFTWMGLSDPEGVWKWVDGTDYKTNFQNWSPGQPDDWDGHGLGGGEDCAHFHSNGQWNDIVCQAPLQWVCETKMDRAS